MFSRTCGFATFIAASLLCGVSTASACDVGNIQCDAAGYRYVCECWTSSGCSYYPDGSCTAYRPGEPSAILRKISHAVGTDPTSGTFVSGTPIPPSNFLDVR